MPRKQNERAVALGQFPKALRIEAKFTTGTTFTVPKREREALLGKDQEIVGVIAALFWCGKREVDGRWFIVDAAESFRTGSSDGGSFDVRDLQRIEKGQTWLAAVREYVATTWPRFLRAFHDAALTGHEALCAELEGLRRANRLHEQVTGGAVLELEHRDAMRTIVNSLGPAIAGHVFQDLLAYLLALAGYNRVQINPIGVPDIEVSEFHGDSIAELVTVTITHGQANRIVKLCQAAGEDDLVKTLLRASQKKTTTINRAAIAVESADKSPGGSTAKP